MPRLVATCRAAKSAPWAACRLAVNEKRSGGAGVTRALFLPSLQLHRPAGDWRGWQICGVGTRTRTSPQLPVTARASRFQVWACSSEGGGPDRPRVDFTLTTPLYYVNAAPHMGSAYPTIAADALARFQRLQGKHVTFVTGTDEHGEKIAASAEANGKAPQEHCNAVAEEYKALWSQFDISYDRFVRTTNPQHEKIVLEFLERVWQKGDIYRAEYEGLYCVNCEEYKDEKDLLEGNCCAIHRKPCSHRREDNFFFKLTNYQKALEELFAREPDFVLPAFRRNEVLGWLKEGVRDFSISRAAVEWGIPIPREPKQTIYVWFDALLGYISALLKEGDEPTLEAATTRGWPASVHIIGKDILRFHAVYWPAMLMAAGLPLPKAVYGHGFLTKDGLKMGKSLGNTLEPKELLDKYGADAVRYFFLREIEFGKDGDFSEERFLNIVNANLANTIGNLLNRTLGLLKKNLGGLLPGDAASLPQDHPLRTAAEASVERAKAGYSEVNFSQACEAAVAIAFAGNEYMDAKAPWAQFKKGEVEKAAAGLDLLAVLESVRITAVALLPVVPAIARRIHMQLGFSESHVDALTWDDTKWGGLKAGQAMAERKPVFARLELPGADNFAQKAVKPAKQGKKEKKAAIPEPAGAKS